MFDVDPAVVVGSVTSLVAAVIAVAGILIQTRRSSRAEVAREKARWDWERAREQERWAREDAARTFDERRAAYISFLAVFDQMESEAHQNRAHGLVIPHSGDFSALIGALATVDLLGTRSAADAGRAAVDYLADAHHDLREPLRREKIIAFRDFVRRDLGVPT